MLALVPSLIALVAAAGGFVIIYRSAKSATLFTRSFVPASAEATTSTIVRGVRRRMLGAVAIAAVFGLAVVPLRISDLPIGAVIGPGIGAASGLLVLGLSPVPRRPPEFGIRQAELIPRTVGGFGPRWGFILPIVAGAVLFALLVATGMSASPVDGAFSHEFMVASPRGGTNSAGPYPGWSYGLPILAASLALIAAVLFALHRVAIAPRIGDRDAVVLDGAIRTALTRFIMLSGTAVIVLYLGAVTLTASEAARSASQWFYVKPSFIARECGSRVPCSFVASPADVVRGVVQPSYTIGAIGAIVGLVLIGVAIVLGILALTNLVIRWSVAKPVERAMVDA